MSRKSAGLLMYRFQNTQLEVLIVHPGGPYWENKDLDSWSIPKGEYEEGENAFATAKREFKEETSYEANGTFTKLTALKQPSGKIVSAWAFEGNCDASAIKSNTFTMEWPPHSGQQAEFPEVDRAGWFPIPLAKKKLLKGQVGFIEELCTILNCPEIKL
jgi:predicted NUDIX family NTP pyrophosphohydrolase